MIIIIIIIKWPEVAKGHYSNTFHIFIIIIIIIDRRGIPSVS